MPNLLIDHAMRNPHVPPGFWRGVNINQNAIFMECFMDELAQAAARTSSSSGRKLMKKHPRNLAVLNAVAEKIGWGKPAPQGIFRGLAQMKAFNAYVAAAAEVSVTGGNKIKVHRIVGGDRSDLRGQPGADRPAGRRLVRVRPVGAVLWQECTVKDGRIVETNFDTYNSMRIAPDAEGRVDHHAESGGDGPWGGVGEPTICVAAPAVLNAFFKATGKRIRSFPLKNHGIELV